MITGKGIIQMSADYKLNIPENLRDKLHSKTGDKFYVILYDNRIEFIPVLDISKFKGFLPGLDTDIERDLSERL